MGEDNDAGTRAPANAPTLDANTALTHAVESDEESLPFELPPPGYQLGGVIGKGGMGEVVAAQDQRIGREVAFKRMHSAHANSESLARFLREARIQARLDHPAIVPVYELGKDAEGRPFFTMKRLFGKTLTQCMQDKEIPRQRLLRAFADVCLAIELAHSRGVIHRDLKPSNIMLGDFGEVYVLDWGIARVLGAKHKPVTSVRSDDIDSIDGEHTMTGDMLGTPGYMAPEQARGELDLDPRADVYSLGAILFEILTGEPLHPRGTAAIASTLTMTEASPAERRPDRSIAPELDAACSAALVADPQLRPTARVLGDRVQNYLDGDRDLERRRTLAEENLAKAREMLASGDPNKRADAVRAAGRALALDAESVAAAELVSHLIVEPPAEQPAELVTEFARVETDRARLRARKAVTGIISLLLLSVALPFLQIESWSWLLSIYAAFAVTAAVLWTTYKTGRILGFPLLICGIVLALVFSRIASPLVLLPVFICGSIVPFSHIPSINDRPWVLYAWCVIVTVAPMLLEATGVLTPTLSVGTADHFELRSAVFAHSRPLGMYALVFANALLTIAVARFAIAIARDRRDVQRKLTNQAWHLGKLLP